MVKVDGFYAGFRGFPYVFLPKSIHLVPSGFQNFNLFFVSNLRIGKAMPVITITIDNDIMIGQEKVSYRNTTQGNLLLVIVAVLYQLLLNGKLDSGIANLFKVAFGSVNTKALRRAAFNRVPHVSIKTNKVSKLADVANLENVGNSRLPDPKLFKVYFLGDLVALLIVRLNGFGGFLATLGVKNAIPTRVGSCIDHFVTFWKFAFFQMGLFLAKLCPASIAIPSVALFGLAAIVTLKSALRAVFSESSTFKWVVTILASMNSHIASKNGDPHRLAVLLSRQHPINLWGPRKIKNPPVGLSCLDTDIIARLEGFCNARGA